MELLGKYVEDAVTGFTGTVTAIAEYLHGEKRAQVERLNTEERIVEEWIAVPRLKVVDKK